MERELARISRGRVVPNAILEHYSRWQIGGPADLLIEPGTVDAVRDCLEWLHHRELPVVVIGDASNILFDDAGVRGVVLRIGRSLSRFHITGQEAWAEAGLFVPRFIRAIGNAGLHGAEHAIGIPGTLGGLVMMNGGSQRKGIGERLTRVHCCDVSGRAFTWTHEQCVFRYRGSKLQDVAAIVLEAEFAFERGDPRQMRREMLGILRDRNAKFPRELPNCGSVFVSDPAMYAIVGPPGKAIEKVNLKGERIGNAQISPLHANFIVNLGGASSVDVLQLIKLARSRVHAQTGFWMQSEVRHVTPEGSIRPAHESAEHLSV
jgi:UDP-N-acetylmuramate dehydrogenase